MGVEIFRPAEGAGARAKEDQFHRPEQPCGLGQVGVLEREENFAGDTGAVRVEASLSEAGKSLRMSASSCWFAGRSVEQGRIERHHRHLAAPGQTTRDASTPGRCAIASKARNVS